MEATRICAAWRPLGIQLLVVLARYSSATGLHDGFRVDPSLPIYGGGESIAGASSQITAEFHSADHASADHGCSQRLSALRRELDEVPFWCPQKAEALYREGQSYLSLDRARDAERAWLEVIKDDPLHPITPELYHDTCQELLKIYAIEDRWEDAYPIIWKSYDHADPVDHPVLLTMRMRPELERVSQKESIGVLTRYVVAAPDDWEALRALARAS